MRRIASISYWVFDDYTTAAPSHRQWLEPSKHAPESYGFLHHISWANKLGLNLLGASTQFLEGVQLPYFFYAPSYKNMKNRCRSRQLGSGTRHEVVQRMIGVRFPRSSYVWTTLTLEFMSV